MSEPKKWLSVVEAGQYFGLRPKTLYDLAGRGRLPEGSVLRIGRAVRLDVRRLEAEAFVKGRR